MPERIKHDIKRYKENQVIIQHLASHYVCGLLPARVRRQVDHLIGKQPYVALNRAISDWETNLSVLDNATPELAPDSTTWQAITEQLAFAAPAVKPGLLVLLHQWFSAPVLLVNRAVAGLALAMAMVVVVTFGSLLYTPTEQALSYIAVLSQNEQPQLIAATYGESLELRLDILNLPDKTTEEDFELWVVSKTDKQIRSLGVVDPLEKSQRRKLSEAQWRLIKDAHSLLLTREEAGGSAIGEPLGERVSYGLCIQMPDWSNTTS